MSIVVTGCAGFIGSHTAEALLKKGKKVIGIDEVNDYYSVKQKEENLDILRQYKNFVFYKESITDYNAMKRIFEGHNPEVVINLAARAGVRASIDNPFKYYESNVRGVLTLLELSKHRVKNFIHASSSSVYGNMDEVPFKEDDRTDRPLSPYAASKKAAEVLCYTYYHLYNLNTVCLRFFTVYGPRGRPDMAPFKFTKAIYEGKPIIRFGNGTSERDYTYVKDIVNGIVSCIDKNFGFEIINLGNNKPVKLNDFIATIERILGKKAKIIEKEMPKADVRITCADISKARRLLNYKPETSLEEGMKRFIDWFLNK